MNKVDQLVAKLKTKKENSMAEIWKLKTHKLGNSIIVLISLYNLSPEVS